MAKIRALIGDRELTFMVKADAYNHGLERVAGSTRDIVNRYGVATVDECARLRAVGITEPISVFSFDSGSARAAKELDATPIVHSFETLKAVGDASFDSVDIKIDSGMHRFGFDSKDACAEVAARLIYYDIHPRAICTHFYSAASVEKQYSALYEIAEPLLAAYPDLKVQVSASDGILAGKYADGVRVGRLAYVDAMSVRSNIIALRAVRKGDGIGYGGDYVAPKDTVIATVQGGYYDGIMRAYTGAEVIIGGQKKHITGRVCMDVFLVDIGDTRVRCGDEVIIIDSRTIDSYVSSAHTNVYEVMTSVKGRAERIYVE